MLDNERVDFFYYRPNENVKGKCKNNNQGLTFSIVIINYNIYYFCLLRYYY